MSTAQFAMLGRGRIEQPLDAPGAASGGRGMVLTAFMALAVYGSLRWATMLATAPGGRMFGLLAVTLAIAWVGSRRAATRLAARVAVLLAIFVATLAMIPMSGFPLAWLLELRIARLARAIGDGLSALPHVIVPYQGQQPATAAVILLGAGMLLAAGALALCTSRPRIGQARLIASAVPLVVLAIVPSALAEPHVAGLHGVILLVALIAFLFSERVPASRAAGALSFTVVAAVVALVLSPQIEATKPWINVKALGTAATAGLGERFSWAQTYGALTWPHLGTEVMTVQARFRSYWKAEDLDLFNGRAWVSSPVETGSQTVGVTPSSLARWTEPLTVTLKDMSTNQIIAAGVANPPQPIVGISLLPGSAPGTWVSEQTLVPGTTYHVDVYAPSPSREQLASAPASYPISTLAPELQLLLPSAADSGQAAASPARPVQFLPFGSKLRVTGYGGFSAAGAATLLSASAYAPVFRLAERLRAGAGTPYAYVRAVLRYLSRGFTYDQSPPTGRYPLLTFLLDSREGYCQQFAGAMALLLRMEGIPARVAAGFTTGTYDSATHSYVVSDIDAHTWVEAWFAGYGWVTFDPTPAVDPALAGHIALPPSQVAPTEPRISASAAAQQARLDRNHTGGATTTRRPTARSHARRPGGAPVALIVVLAALALGSAAALAWRRPLATEGLLAELERALARSGRPLAPEATLAMLQRRFADAPDAAEYVRRLQLSRFAGEAVLPTGEQRRALRRRLRQGLGPLGWVRSMFALPPRRGHSGAGRGRLRHLH